jgi:cobalt-zinc-cadmium efflux system outer membrane protein
MHRLTVVILLAAVLTGCSGRSSKVTPQVSKKIEDRTGRGLNPNPQPPAFALPPGVSLADGLTEDEAVAIALWNNAAFQADLTSLGFARADLIEAGQLRNPMLTLLLPWGPKQLEATANLPLEVFWQRPRRVAAARVDLERVAESLVQTGLNLVRDARVAYVELALANERARIASDEAGRRNEIAQIVRARFRAGDISELETSASRIDAQRAEEQAKRFAAEAMIASDRLRFLLGTPAGEPSFKITAFLPASPAAEGQPISVAITGPPTSAQQVAGPAVDELIRQALASRPDLRAAELAIEAAGKRARWERSRIFSLTAILDANAEGKSGFEAGPGFQVELPVFNRNRGGITRAEAEIERAARQYMALRQRIVLEVKESCGQLLQARQSLDSLRGQIIPQIEEEIRISQKAFAAGDVAYLFVLETSRKITDARLGEAEASAAVLRATAQLERAVGRKISDKPR